MILDFTITDLQNVTGWTYKYAQLQHKKFRDKWGVPVIDIPLFLEKRYNRTFNTREELEAYVKKIGLRK